MAFYKDIPSGGSNRKRKDPTRIVLSEDEKRVLEQLNRLVWPKGSARYLPSVVRSSMRNYKRFLKRFHKILDQSKKKYPDGLEKTHGRMTYNDLHDFIQHKLSIAFLPAESYIYCWFEAFHQKVVHWKKWNGKIRPFQISSQEFQNEGYDLAIEYGGNHASKLWRKFMEMIDSED